MSRETKSLYLTEEETRILTQELIKYNKINNPIKIFNQCYDYYIETYNIKPVYCDDWSKIIEVRKNFEYNKIEKSINRAMNNINSNKIKDYDNIRKGRQQEVDEYISVVKKRDPQLGKQKNIECPLIVWKGIEKIAVNYAQNYKFFGYVQKEDLIMGAIEKCLRYMGNFSGVSSDNAFSFFSTTVRNSFLESIKKEYDFSNLKQKINTYFYDSSNEERSEMQSGNYLV